MHRLFLLPSVPPRDDVVQRTQAAVVELERLARDVRRLVLQTHLLLRELHPHRGKANTNDVAEVDAAPCSSANIIPFLAPSDDPLGEAG